MNAAEVFLCIYKLSRPHLATCYIFIVCDLIKCNYYLDKNSFILFYQIKICERITPNPVRSTGISTEQNDIQIVLC